MPPGLRITSGASPVMVNGSCARIWDGDTLNKGSATPLSVAHTLPSVEGSGSALAAAAPGARPLPLILARPPGATPGRLSAALATLETTGICVGASNAGSTAVSPEI